MKILKIHALHMQGHALARLHASQAVNSMEMVADLIKEH